MADQERLLAAIDAAAERAYGSDNDSDLADDRALLIRMYQGENVEPAPTGRSQVVDRSIFETIQWILPSLCRVFANGSDLVSLPPLGPDDEAGAKQEQEYLNHVITQQNPWFQVFLEWATDALMTRNAYVLAWMDRQTVTEVERYERQTQEGVAMLAQEQGTEIRLIKQYLDEQAQGQPQVGPDGMPLPLPMLFDVEVRRANEKRKVCLRVLPPERTLISQYTPSWRVAEADYFEYYESKTLSQLRAEGFDVPDEIVTSDMGDDTFEDQARDVYEETRDEAWGGDPSMKRVKARCIWIRFDHDEDGIAELMYVVRVGSTILYSEEVSTIPVACMVPSPLPHRHLGLSIGDMVLDIQRIKTVMLRAALDNLYTVNSPQKVINQNLVNLDDVLNPVPGGIIRTDDVNAIRYEQIPPVFPQALQALEYMDQVRENRTGTNRYFTGIDQNALNKTATGVQTLSTMAAQRVEQIARIMGSAIEDLARIVHEIVLKAGHKSEVLKLRGEWVEIDPATWRKRSDFRISVGFAAGNKDAMVARLQNMLMNQFQSLQMGLPIVQPQNVYETMLELAKAGDFSTPERFWTDPAQVQPQPQGPNPEVIKLQGEMAAKQADLELRQQEMQAQAVGKTAELSLKEREIEQKAVLEKYRIDKDAETKVQLALLQGQVQAELDQQRATLEDGKARTRMDEKAQKDHVTVQQVAEEQTAQIASMLEGVLEVVEKNLSVLRAQKRIKRGKDGRAEAVEELHEDGTVVTKPVLRDEQGRIVGTA